MVDTVTSQTLLNGPRNLVMKFTNVSDGTGESAVVKVDVSEIEGTPEEVRIVSLDVLTSGMGVDVLWGADSDAVALTIPADFDDEIWFDQPLVNNAGTGKTGDIKFSTVGADSGDRYAIIMHMKKVAPSAAATEDTGPGSGDAYLLEGGDSYLLEDGDLLVFEHGAVSGLLTDETGTNLTDENGVPLEID